MLNHQKKASKLKPSFTVKTESRFEINNIAKKTTGGGLIFSGDHIYSVVGGLIIYLGTRK